MEARTLVLMGRTGNGKSSTGNSIVGRNVFKTGFSFTSVTKECQLEQTTLKDGRIINVIDTPDECRDKQKKEVENISFLRSLFDKGKKDIEEYETKIDEISKECSKLEEEVMNLKKELKDAKD
ncbi:immune-associated nucleotide-binding protein 11-like [Cryptomeria japonica]|uniref:immune-associated nucleotide-binding protein 11-like n=1 Tax=Cryptomeria japonica TaxID=3369 RepID=UPI0025AB7717|nr:immune-associated nucleotide-binding protein 11-like [Cryptomeria japonica]